MNPVSLVKSRKKAVWGRNTLIAFFIASLAAVSVPATAGPGNGKGNGNKQHEKLDRLLNQVVDTVGETDVIVEFHDGEDRDGGSRITNAGGRAGRPLKVLNAVAGRMPNALLRRLADDSHVKRVHIDRGVTGEMARTVATIGALTARMQYGYSGAGIGVAVIDSGITPNHDDLGASASSKLGQRVTKFVDFINNRTTKYDDWGHGTHVTGIIAGNGYDSYGERSGVAPRANIISLKALDAEGKGRISHIIAALDWVVANHAQYNIRVVNMSLGAGVFESYNTDPLTLAAKRAVDAGIVVVAAAGNYGKAKDGTTQYGAIGAPGNAPWVLTVGASSTEGTVDRRDDKVAGYSSRGPTMIDFDVKPDLVAPGTGTVSLATPDSLFYLTKSSFLVPGKRLGLLFQPYLTLSGTSMAAPVVAGTVALMLEANPNLTPNMVKAILQYTAEEKRSVSYLAQGAGFLNTLGAVRLSRFFAVGQKGDQYPNMKAWSRHIFWGNRRVKGGVLAPGGTAWGLNIVWGDAFTPQGQNIVWGENCDTANCDNIVWGNNIVWGETDASDNIVWGNTDGDNVVWGNGSFDSIVWGNLIDDNIVWGNDCGGADCDNIVWGNSAGDNIVWGNAEGLDNIVWGNTLSLDNIVWGNSAGDEDVSWGSSAGDEDLFFSDDTAEVESFNPDLFDDLFEVEPIVIVTTVSTSGGVQ